MKSIGNFVLALLIGCCTPLLIWIGAGNALYQSRKRASQLKRALPNVSCRIDTDCPPGFICVGGFCVPERGAPEAGHA